MGTTRTDFLFATPTFIEGAATVFSIAGLRHAYNRSETPEQADYLAVSSDWAVIGEDIDKSTKSATKKRVGSSRNKK